MMKFKKKLALFLTVITLITAFSTATFAMDGNGTGKPVRELSVSSEEF